MNFFTLVAAFLALFAGVNATYSAHHPASLLDLQCALDVNLYVSIDVGAFIVVGDKLMMKGKCSCKDNDNEGKSCTLPVLQVLGIGDLLSGGKCSLVEVDIGPVNVDLLGIRVHVDGISLDIKTGGGVLGNLLCGLVGKSLLTLSIGDLTILADNLNKCIAL